MRANFNCRCICRQAPTVLLVALAVTFPAGCNNNWAGRPERVQFTENKKETENILLDLEKKYDEPGADAQRRRDIRDQYARKMISVIDQRYESFLDVLVSQRKGFDASADITAISLSTASALFAPVTTKSILAGLSALTIASKTAISKVYFYEQTLPALLSQMEGNRQAVLADIVIGLNDGVDKYPLQQTLRDLHRYYTAGTIDGAVTEIQKQASDKSKDAQERIKAIRTEVESDLKAAHTLKKQALDYIQDGSSFSKMRSVITKWWSDPNKDDRSEQISVIEQWAEKDGVALEPLKKEEKIGPEFLGKWLGKLEYNEATRLFLADIWSNARGIELPK
jgi:hypothetical protein